MLAMLAMLTSALAVGARSALVVDQQLVGEDWQNLLQTAAHTNSRGSRAIQVKSKGLSLDVASSCVELTNMGSFFTVATEVGTPGQSFDVVADTGSNTLVVPSCACTYCNQHDNCFESPGLTPLTFQAGDTTGLWVLSYGSGDIYARRVTDVVRVGAVEAMMENNVYLMVKTDLDFASSFEGILGLGLPDPSSPQFLDNAGVDRFSVCFNDAGQPGALRFEPQLSPTMLPQIGQVHWGLGLAGISAGPNSSNFACTPSSLAPGQETPCGVIPDSGTTLMMGPPDQIRAIYAGVCDRWPRCRDRAQGNSESDRATAFQLTLYECEDWLPHSSQGIREVPSLFWNLTGGSNETVSLEVTAWAYVTESLVQEVEVMTKRLWGYLDVTVPVYGDTRRVCTASFGPQDYYTVRNGPVWILGSPIFYEHQVVFGRQNPASGSIGFATEPCHACSGGSSLVASAVQPAAAAEEERRAQFRQPRRFRSPARVRKIDTSSPL